MNTWSRASHRLCACALLLALTAQPALAAPAATQGAKPAQPAPAITPAAKPAQVKPAAASTPPAQPAPLQPAPKPAAAATQVERDSAQSKVLLWQVRSATATVYLLGSVHVGSADAYPLDPRIEQAFAQADTLVLEVPLDAGAVAKAAAMMQKAGLYAPPDSLDKHLDAATLAKLKTAIATTGMPAPVFMQMRPWFAGMTLALLRLQTAGYEPQHGIDVHFFNAIGTKRFQALETIEEQAGMLSGMPPAMQIDNLRQTLDELDQISGIMDQAFAAWRRGDASAIDELMLAPFRKRYPALYKRLFLERNRRMASEIERLLAGKGTAFVVIGAGHLVGKDSVLQRLTTKTRVPKQL